MVYSMTGFGASKFENDKYRIQVEVKSLNSKHFDLQLRTPRVLSSKEMEIRALVSKQLQRGKVNLMIDVEAKTLEEESINKSLFKSTYKELSDLAAEVGYTGDEIFKLALQQTEQASTSLISDTPDDLWALVTEHLDQALVKCSSYRKTEGEHLEIELKAYNKRISELKLEVEGLEKKRAERVRERLKEGLQTIVEKEEVDANRLEQELIYYLEKLDITEELVRLESHTSHFKKIISEPNCGKKLGFLSQEIGREINTIGSKANDAEIQKVVVLMKEELEKIKEQSLNVL